MPNLLELTIRVGFQPPLAVAVKVVANSKLHFEAGNWPEVGRVRNFRFRAEVVSAGLSTFVFGMLDDDQTKILVHKYLQKNMYQNSKHLSISNSTFHLR